MFHYKFLIIAFFVLLSCVANRYLITGIIGMKAKYDDEYSGEVDYKYVYINYVSWILILALFYCIGFFWYYMNIDNLIDIVKFNQMLLVEMFGPNFTLQNLVTSIVFVVSVALTMAMFLIETKHMDEYVSDAYPTVRYKSILPYTEDEDEIRVDPDSYDFTLRLIEFIDFVVLILIIYLVCFRQIG